MWAVFYWISHSPVFRGGLFVTGQANEELKDKVSIKKRLERLAAIKIGYKVNKAILLFAETLTNLGKIFTNLFII